VVWVYLTLAIALEVAGTSLLPRTQGFRRLRPTLATLGLYAVAIYLLSLVLRSLDVGIMYALWAGLGTAAVAAIGMVFLGERTSVAKVVGIGLVVAGVVVLNLGGAH